MQLGNVKAITKGVARKVSDLKVNISVLKSLTHKNWKYFTLLIS